MEKKLYNYGHKEIDALAGVQEEFTMRREDGELQLYLKQISHI